VIVNNSTLNIVDSNVVVSSYVLSSSGHIVAARGKVDLTNVVFTNLMSKKQSAIVIHDDGQPGTDVSVGYLGSLVTCHTPVYFCPRFRSIVELPTTSLEGSSRQLFNNTNCNTAGDMVDESQCSRWVNVSHLWH
jgi:hypothetical protein